MSLTKKRVYRAVTPRGLEELWFYDEGMAERLGYSVTGVFVEETPHEPGADQMPPPGHWVRYMRDIVHENPYFLETYGVRTDPAHKSFVILSSDDFERTWSHRQLRSDDYLVGYKDGIRAERASQPPSAAPLKFKSGDKVTYTTSRGNKMFGTVVEPRIAYSVRFEEGSLANHVQTFEERWLEAVPTVTFPDDMPMAESHGDPRITGKGESGG